MSKKLEKKIEKDIQLGKYKEVSSKKKHFQTMALDSKDRINLRIDPKVKAEFIKRSEEEGLSYQTLINSVLKKYVSGKLIEGSIDEIVQELRKEIKSLKKGA